ncbi:DUF7344 domain-containing protein [Natrinema gelatinilyticum]|uniref:DUF7344 domain-containing protein n=1 Tax=Natrinema gelatinilyticum TaxID=2961571 RepID=UPI0020C208F8|nr:hypothetical protein [Natrinema gelatinilyticum]
MSLPPSSEATTAVDVLAEPRRRYVLAAFLERSDAVPTDRSTASPRLSVDALATEVATMEYGRQIVPDDQCTQIDIDLRHAHVPRLVDIGVLSRRTRGDATTVALLDHPMLEIEWVQALLADPTGETLDMDEEVLNRTLKALRAPRRRTVYAVLATRRERVSISDLAAVIVTLEDDGEMDLAEVTDAETAPVTSSLVHSHLPALSDVGLVSYDAAAKRVSLATDSPQQETNWLLKGLLSDAVDVRHAEQTDGTTQRRPIADEPTTDAPTDDGAAATDVPAADEAATAADRDKMLWTLAQPPAERSSTGGRSSREITTPSETSSAVSDPHDGPPST